MYEVKCRSEGESVVLAIDRGHSGSHAVSLSAEKKVNMCSRGSNADRIHGHAMHPLRFWNFVEDPGKKFEITASATFQEYVCTHRRILL